MKWPLAIIAVCALILGNAVFQIDMSVHWHFFNIPFPDFGFYGENGEAMAYWEMWFECVLAAFVLLIGSWAAWRRFSN